MVNNILATLSDYRIVPKNLRLINHTVCFGELPDNPAGISCGKGVGRNVLNHDASCADDTTAADGNAGTDYHIRTEPAIIANMYRLCIA